MKKFDLLFLASVAVLAVLFIVFRGPHMLGDTPSYVEAIQVMQGGQPGPEFIPNRLLTTYGSLDMVHTLGRLFGDLYFGWFMWNLGLYVLSCFVFHKLLERIFGSARVAYLGALFLAGSYGYLLFGLHYLMDIGGWAFYIFALYFLFLYAQAHDRRNIFRAALLVGIGGLCKEYAFLAGIAIGIYILTEFVLARMHTDASHSLRLRDIAGVVALGILPTAVLYLYVYHRFGYTYLDWLGFNTSYYSYQARLLEYVKSFGSLYNLLAVPVIAGAVILVRQWKTVSRELRLFLIATLVSFLPIFCWPAVTQRILTITVPFSIVIACFCFKKFENRWYLFLPVLVLYILATFYMDSYLLNAVNLPL